MRRTSYSNRQRFIARLVLITVLLQWLTPPAFAAQPQEPAEASPLPLASTVSAIPAAQTLTFTDATLIGKEPAEVVGKWIRFFTEDKPAGLITQVTAFNSETGQITLLDPLPAGAVTANDVYHLAESRDVLLPTNIDPDSIGPGSIGCAPTGTDDPDDITCIAIDATGVDAKKGDDVVSVTAPTVVLVTKFGSDKKEEEENGNEVEAEEEEETSAAKSEAKAINLGEGNDRIVNDGTVVAAAVALVSETPKNPSENEEGKKEETKAAAKAEPTAVGIDAGAGQNTVTNNGRLSTSATALLLARQLPGEAEDQKNADVSSTATATSSAIQAGGDGSFITNTGRLASRAIAITAGVGISASSKEESPAPGNAPAAEEEEKKDEFTFKGDVKATATASGITVGAGNDTVTNTSDIIVTGSAVTVAAGATEIKAKGSAGASATSEAISTSQAVALGDGNDILINTGTLTANATSRAISLEIAIADKNNTPAGGSGTNPPEGGAPAVAADPPEAPKDTTLTSTIDSSATAKARATGISADAGEAKPDGAPIFNFGDGAVTIGRETTETRAGGNDSVNNSGSIDVNATSRALASSGGITVDGGATVKNTSTSDAIALAIDLGGGNDTLTNSGAITAIADAIATALGVAVAQKATSSSAPAPSEGQAPAVDPPPADESKKNEIAITTVVESSSTATSSATGITADGALQTQSDKWTATAKLSKEFDFLRETSTTQAIGVDTVNNSGAIAAAATSLARAASIGLSADGAATIKATSTADAAARGIDLGGGSDTLTNAAAGQIVTIADATANALSLAIGFKTAESAKEEIKSAATVGTTATAKAAGVIADGLEADTATTITLAAGGGRGLSLEIVKTTTLANGDDTVTNDGGVSATATALTNAIGVAIGTDGKATVDATSVAGAQAVGIDLGGGNDTGTNTGAISATATGTANALGIAVGVKGGSGEPETPPANPPAAPAGNQAAAPGNTVAVDPPAEPPAPAPETPAALESANNASAKASATAIGISADGVSTETTQRGELQIGGGPTFLTASATTRHASGNDAITNSGTIDSTASATSGALDVSVTMDGKAAAKLESKAEASAAAIDLGAGNDTLTNTAGTLTATATAIARALAAAVGIKSDQSAKSTAESAVDASVEAEARATGIAADALTTDLSVALTIQHLEGVLSINGQGSQIRGSGDDRVTNAANVTSTATATSREIAAGVAVDGSTAAKTTSTATAESAGIDLGGGNDTLTSNTGALTVDANATARTIGVAVGVQGSSSGGSSTAAEGDPPAAPETPKATAAATKAAVDASATSNATAIGLVGDSLRADQTTSIALSLAGFRPQLHVEIAETRGSGNDTLTNDGAITTTATSSSRALAGGLGVGGEVTVKTSSTANATAAGIDLGGGNDTITNNGTVVADASALAEAVNLAIVVKSESGSSDAPAVAAEGDASPAPTRAKSSVDASATAEARATGLASDSTQKDGLLKVDLTVGDTLAQGAVFDFVKSETRASGDDTVINTGNLEATASATTAAAGIGLVAEGTATARTSSSADAAASAIDLGAGADGVTNDGTLKATATALAGGLAVSFTNKGRSTDTEGFFAASEGLWKGGIEAQATALGIDGSGAATKSTTFKIVLNGIFGVDVRFAKLEDGVSADLADIITNRGNIEATASATAGSLNVAASAEGSAGAVSNLESEALAAGIRGGQGDDTIKNLGSDRLTLVTASATTAGATVSVSGKGVAVAADTLWSSGTGVEAKAIGIDGDGGILKSKRITLINNELVIEKQETGGAGNDHITNEQAITALASALAPSLGVSIETKKGVAATVSSVESAAEATAIRGGAGDDIITNRGFLLVGSSALSAAANIAIAKEGVAAAGGAVWDGGTKAESTAIGIDADGAATTTKTTTLTVTQNGVSIVNQKQDDTVAGAGHDTVTNLAGITVTADAETDALAVAGTTKGVSAAFAQSNSEATAAAIRGGGGNDILINQGALSAIATAIARALNVSVETSGGVAIAGNGVWDGGTTADARATGILGDGGSTKTKTTTISIGGGDLINTEKTDVAATGNDTITNTARIDVLADATAREASVAVPIKGVGVAISTSTAEANAAAINTGGGTDTVTNSGELHSTATAAATTANVAVTKAGVAVAADAVWDGGTTARAVAAGITAADSGATVNNFGAIEVNSSTTSLSGSVAVAISGVAVATATSTADSRAVGIALGGGGAQDTLNNFRAITVQADALAAAASVSVSNAGLAISADSVWNGGTKATSVARGILDAGGPDTVQNSGRIEANASAATGSATVAVAVSGVAGAIGTATATADASAIDLGPDGADLLVNKGQLLSDALALAGTVNVAVTTAGVAGAGNDVWDGGTKAEAIARTISVGGGDDVVVNVGDVSADADALTVAVPVSVAVSGVGVAIGTSTATAVATAIDGGVGDNTITNLNASIPNGTGKLVADATADAVTATVAVTTAGVAVASDAVWNGGTTGEAVARGIKTSLGGNDTINNDGAIDATSTARAGSASVAVAVSGVAVALANSSALSNATAIDSGALYDGPQAVGADTDTVLNRGTLTVNANALALAVPVAVTAAGVAAAGTSVWNGGTTADAKAVGISTRAGDDTIENHGTIGVDADATSGTVSVSVAVAGFAASIATSTAKAEASAIDAGDGADRLTNTGKLTADSTALAGTVTVAVTPAGVAVAGDAVWDGGTKAEALTRTITAGDGADRVRNVGNVNAISVADTASAAVTVAVAGVGVSSATSTATSNATAIALDGGDDVILNMSGGQADRMGKLVADATANAVAASVSVTPAGVAIASDAVWRGGTTATATAAGIDGGLGKDTVVNAAEMDIDSTARTASVSAAVVVFGVSAALVSSTANASGTGIKTGHDVRNDNGDAIDTDLASEADVVVNSGRLIVDVDALATSLGIGFSFGGMTAAANNLWDGGTTANAFASGIGLGNGWDEVTNSGVIDIASIANAVSASLGITVFGVSAAASTATANARSTALDGGDGNDIITNLATGMLTSDATATSVGANVAFVAIGATAAGDTVWNGGTTADVAARGVDGGLGKDAIVNDGTIAAKADSTTASVSVSITGIGVGGATATSTSTGRAIAIDGGADDDTITSRGNATATALATANGVAVSATGIGGGAAFDSFFNGGTKANAIATGLAGGAGNDIVILEDKTVTADASSDTRSTSVAVTIIGLAGGAAASTSTANATGIDGGVGIDTIVVDSALVSKATSTAAGNSISVSTLGSVAGGFDSSTKAEAVAVGVAGGDDVDTITLTDNASTTLTANASTKDTAVSVAVAILGISNSQAVSIARATGVDGGAGNDTINQDGTLTGTLTAESKSRAVTVNYVGGVALGDVSGRSTIAASGVDGGLDDDIIINRGTIALTGTATARGNAISAIGTGVANADAASVSDASITGLQGGDGVDTIVNVLGGDLSANATAKTIANGLTFNLSVAGSSSTQTTPTATATGIDGGAGNDEITNNGRVTALANATSSATGSSITLIGQSGTSAGTEASANATGLGGGFGNDRLFNRSQVFVTGLSEATVSGSSWTLGGGAGNSSVFRATGLAAGMTGGAGGDLLQNDLFLDVTFSSKLTATGGANAIFGRANANTQLTATGGAIGIGGDADADIIANLGIINVDAKADVNASKATVSFAGSPTADALLSAHATATGLGGGSGSDEILNDGTITLRATGISNVSGGAEATVIGSPKVNGAGTANATATGIQGGEGSQLTNSGLVDLLARGDAVTTNSSSAGLLFSAGLAKSDARSLVNAFGIAADGNNTLVNSSDLLVKADASGYANTIASGAHISINGAATATADARATAAATGMLTKGGENTIVNSGLLSVLGLAGTTRDITRTDTFCSTSIVHTPQTDENGDPVLDGDGNPVTVPVQVHTCEEREVTLSSSPTYAAANGNGTNGVGRSTAVATTRVDGFGVRADDGDNTVVNVGDIEVTSRPNARVTAFADGDLLAEAFGTATATATAAATGVQLGNGNNSIFNVGALTVLAEPAARVSIDVTTALPVCIDFLFGTWCGDGGIGTADARATLSGTAVGVKAGNGDNVIVNSGVLTVNAIPSAADPIAITHADVRHESTTVTASATGIQTGSGDNSIENAAGGVIDVAAKHLTACTGCSRSLTAVGIKTDSGDDTIVNDGILTAAVVTNAGTQFTTSIDAGDGNDRVVLGSASQTKGSILLGAGNDRFVWSQGAVLTGTVTPGSGDDIFALGGSQNGTLNLSGAGPIAGMNIFTSFEDFYKEGSSTWTLTGSRDIDWIVEEGTLIFGGAITGTVTTPAGDTANALVAVNQAGTLTSPDARPTVLLNTNGILVNEGSVVTTAAGGAAVQTVGDNTAVVNRGSIVADAVGVRSSGDQGVIVNSGLIAVAGTAVSVAGTGNVVQNAGTIAGGDVGIALGSGNAVTNSGTIAAAAGPAIVGGSGSEQVTNHGLIAGGAGVAVDLGAGDDELTIANGARFDGVANGGTGDDTVVLGGASGVLDVSTFGATYRGFEKTVMRASLWTLAGDGAIDVTVDRGLLHVAGGIQGTLQTSATASGAEIFVGSSASITSGSNAAVVLQGSNTLVNAGVIDGAVVASGGAVSIVNVGEIYGGSRIAVAGGDGGQQVENHGLIVSSGGTAIDLGSGNDVLSVSTSSRIGGDVRGGSGFDTLRLIGGGSVALGLGTVDGFETLNKEGNGTWLLTGSSPMAWNVLGGSLVVNGSLTGAGSIESGGWLAGNGLVGGFTNAGTVSPGMSIGTIHVAGDYAQTGTGALLIEGANVSDVSDRLNITGRAALDGTLDLRTDSRPFGIATEYTILSAAGGVTGTFAATTQTASNLDTYVDYLPQSVNVALVRNDISFAAMGETANLTSLGGALDMNKRSMARGDFKGVMDQFLTMDAPAQTSALKSLSGELHAALPTTLMHMGERFLSASATRRVSAQQSGERMTMWTDYVRFNGNVSGNGDVEGASYGSSGFVGGADVAIGRARVGGSFGYANGSSALDHAGAGGARVRSRMPAVYGRYAAGPVLVEGAFGYGEHVVRTARQIEVGSIRRQAVASYKADQYTGLTRISVALPVRSILAVAPFVETRYSQVTRRGFDETGADSVSLTGVGAFELESLQTLVGLRTTPSTRLFGNRFEPSLSLAWTRAGGDRQGGMLAALNGTTTRSDFQMFTLNGAADSRHGAFINAGTSMLLATHGRAFVAYDGLLTDARTEHSFAAGLRLVW